MKALILAAGLGSRLKPWTDSHPKALVPVGRQPMLQRVVEKLLSQGFDDIVVNVHHFSSQIIDFLADKSWPVRISDESGMLLDTGGGIAKASSFFEGAPFLVHNVDILSDADLGMLMTVHLSSGNDATLLVSDRESSRKLVFNEDMNLEGWHDLSSGSFRPEGFRLNPQSKEYAFSGIHIVGEGMAMEMRQLFGDGAYPVMNYYLSKERKSRVGGFLQRDLHLIDIGKPATLSQACSIFENL